VTPFLNPHCSATYLLFACKCSLNLLIIRVSDISGKVVASDLSVLSLVHMNLTTEYLNRSIMAILCCYEELRVWLSCLPSSDAQYLLILLEISSYPENFFFNLGGFYYVYNFCFFY
jgi:hypothetical protein